MKHSRALSRALATAVGAIAIALVAGSVINISGSARPARLGERDQAAAQGAAHARLRSLLSSTSPIEFYGGLAELARLDEPRALEVWQTALDNPDGGLREEAWRRYRQVRLELVRKESVPQIVRISAPPSELTRLAGLAGLEVIIWSEGGGETIAAAPPYLVELLRRRGIASTVLYDSVADWQKARSRGESQAVALTPEYQSERATARLEVRIAIIDLRQRREPEPGFSDWLGDPENILARSDDFLAYLDIFESDGSSESIAAHVRRQYSSRGYELPGFYTASEFAETVGRFFPRATFNSGGGTRGRKGALAPRLSEGRFHSYDEALAEFNSLAQSHPELARLVNLGPTYEGRQVFALKVSRSPEVDDRTKPDVLITGCYHAREWISVEPPIYFAQQLVNGYDTDDSIKYLVDHLQIWIVPIVNPDGLIYSQGSANDQQDAVRLWRKNRKPVTPDCPRSSAAVGVDLNRNYDFHWRLDGDQPCNDSDDVGASDIPSSELFRGARADSELEIKAIKSLTGDPARRFRAQLDFHNYSQLVLYPWGFQEQGTSDSEMLSLLAGQISDQILSVDRRFYKPQQAVSLYTTTGTSLDYAYGVDRIPGSFTIELRPSCCGFTVAENEITAANQENWAGAKVLLNWAAAPPFLESVKAYQTGPDGSLSKLVYSASWVGSAYTSTAGRRMVVDTRFPAFEPGRLQVRLQFSKPMNTAAAPVAMLGRGARLDEMRLAIAGAGEGWQKTVYPNDTWVGEVVLAQEPGPVGPWRLSVAASDSLGSSLDAMPETVAEYAIGTGHWRSYEDATGEDTEGGADTKHALAPTLPSTQYGLVVGAPGSNERLAGGDVFSAAWTVPRASGLTPTHHELWLSTAGGFDFSLVAQGIAGNVDKSLFVVPRAATTDARLRVVAYDGTPWNAIYGDTPASFTIGANVTGGCEIALVSSELLSRGWTTPYFDGRLSGATQLALTVSVTNRTATPIANPFLRVADFSRNVLLSRDVNSRPTVAARQSMDAGGDDVLSGGESVQVTVMIGLVSKKKFSLALEMYGVPVGGSISAGSAVQVWRGKPRSG